MYTYLRTHWIRSRVSLYTIGSYARDAMFNHTRVNFRRLADVDMVLFVEHIYMAAVCFSAPTDMQRPITCMYLLLLIVR